MTDFNILLLFFFPLNLTYFQNFQYIFFDTWANGSQLYITFCYFLYLILFEADNKHRAWKKNFLSK